MHALFAIVWAPPSTQGLHVDRTVCCHAAGVCHYMNGDYYEGEWQAGLRHGRGMQQCADGSNYVSSQSHPEHDCQGSMLCAWSWHLHAL